MFQEKWQALIDEISNSADWQKLIAGNRIDLLLANKTFNTTLKSIFLLLQWLKQKEQPLFLIFPEEIAARKFYNTLLCFLNKEHSSNIIFYRFPFLNYFDESHQNVAQNNVFDYNRLRYLLLNLQSVLVITTVQTICKRIQKKEIFSKSCISFFTKEKITPLALKEHLESIGYQRVSLVRQKGEYSLRNEIVDIFGILDTVPFRIAFFDDEIEEIHTLDIKEQKIKKKLSKIDIVANDFFCISKEQKRELQRMNLPLEEDTEHGTLQKQAEFFFADHKQMTSIFSYAVKPLNVFWYQKESCQNRFENFYRHCEQYYQFSQMKKEKNYHPAPEKLFFSFDQIEKTIFSYKKDHEDDVHDLTQQKYQILVKKLENCTHSQHQFKSHQLIHSYWEHAKLTNKKLILLSEADSLDEVQKIFDNYQPLVFNFTANTPSLGSNLKKHWNTKDLLIIDSELMEGFEWQDKVFISTNEIFNLKKKKKTNTENKIEHFLDLKKGDYVVHLNHGIGRFQELRRLVSQTEPKIEKDYFYIVYANQAAIFVPVDQVHLLQKYLGKQNPQLDKIGGSSWEKIKNRVKKQVRQIAQELVSLYAKRESLVSTPFPRDTVWQKDFASQFPYPLTRDQKKTIAEIKNDLESPKPMDRILCGDVGFGKTEVAMQIIFKVAMNNRQTAFIVPTTILSQQHYKNFKKRFQDFPVKIEILNRFTDREKEQEILAKIFKGEIDILIGTHKLFSQKIEFANLGLLVIDEEHKFGVIQKENIRNKYPLVDTLALSATPIPRTLHLSLINIRDISIIQTPPAKRQAINTVVALFSEKMIVEVIRKEIVRQGQVYFIHNRIQDIHVIGSLLQKHLPDLNIKIAHGRMSEIQLERIMLEFIENKFHVLISTTIIESGIDIPNVNTIIVNNAHALGLSQLHQIRGRIGRSERQGFAYFFYDPTLSISEQAMKRLQTIAEYSQLGAGFHIAMRDLEIRGTGNILGAEQSGNILAVGFDLYCQLLQEAIAISKQDKKNETDHYYQRTSIDLQYIAYISDDYISDEKQKIQIYKRINSLNDLSDIETYRVDLNTKYGKMPASLSSLFQIAEIRISATALGILSIVEKGESIFISFLAETKIAPEKIITLISRCSWLQFEAEKQILTFNVAALVKEKSKQKKSSLTNDFNSGDADNELAESLEFILEFKIKPLQNLLEFLGDGESAR